MMRLYPALFVIASASPLGMLALAGGLGGVWVWAALGWMTLAAVTLDTVIPLARRPAPEVEFPGSDGLLVGLALSALVTMPVLVWGVAGPGDLGGWARGALFLAGSLWLGQVGHPAAHELIHRSARFKRGLGVAVYSALLFGHHASAHRMVHHRHVGTAADPNSAAAGEGYYRYLWRVWPASFAAGFVAERALRGGRWVWPYGAYVAGAVLALGAGYGVAGWPGVLIWLALGFHFSTQVLLSDYVQHYGLVRALAAGRALPVTARHSWNTPHWFSSALMLNAPRHSDHHTHPQRSFAQLRLEEDAPMLPWPLPLACLVALYPPYWRRRMKPLVAEVLAKA